MEAAEDLAASKDKNTQPGGEAADGGARRWFSSPNWRRIGFQ
jgi:hypothetical protein